MFTPINISRFKEMDKKFKLLQELFARMLSSGWLVQPTYMSGKRHITIVDDSDNFERKTIISLDNTSTVKVVTEYHVYKYDNTLDDRRNAIKTAKDIFEFVNDLKCGKHDCITTLVRALSPPNVALYYYNSTTADSVIVTATNRYSYEEFIVNYDNHLRNIGRELNRLTKLIELDNAGIGREKRWEKEVIISKQWWSH